jgi:hypothetical protein
MKKKLEQKSNDPIVVMVLGAGRGPLVRKTLEALNSWDPNLSKLVSVYALDKNPLAVERYFCSSNSSSTD